MAQRLLRHEQQDRTRQRLLDAARSVFLRRGFHAASLAEIAAEAGYTTGAVYSNFGGKDELFLAMLESQQVESAAAQTERALGSADFEGGVRAVARELHRTGEREPMLTPTMLEFWIYAANDTGLRKRLLELNDRQLDRIVELLAEIARRHSRRFVVPLKDVARGGGALSRGIRAERLVDPAGVPEELFEEMFFAYVSGLSRPLTSTEEANR
jgi:AcrR family transcriptional regulator